MSRKFTRTLEDFICAHCGAKVSGNGYTNHCPKCLWSKHVDINPGDRAGRCGGLMELVGFEQKGRWWRVVHRCQKCQQTKVNKLSSSDSLKEALANLSSKEQ